jgi:hypothetical protein
MEVLETEQSKKILLLCDDGTITAKNEKTVDNGSSSEGRSGTFLELGARAKSLTVEYCT